MGAGSLIRILLADEQEVVRHGLRAVLETEAGFAIAGETGCIAEAAALAAALRPDVAILDFGSAEMDGLQAARAIRDVSPGTEVLVFTLAESERVVRDVLAAGAKGFILKSEMPEGVLAAVAALARHRPYFSARIGETVVNGFVRDGGAPPFGPLSRRQQHVACLIACGRTAGEIAKRLRISVKTVETHRAAAMRKLGVQSSVELARYVLKNLPDCTLG
jgi:DNA-binding NarL/FixJ family response regulator